MNHPHAWSFFLKEAEQLQRLGAWRLCGQALLTGLIAGSIIGLFRRLYDSFRLYASYWLQLYAADTPWAWAYILGGLALLAALAHLLLRHEPLISGSGIPQVELMATGLLPLMRWRRVLWCKFVATLAALSAGLSLGREGPCIQMGACVRGGRRAALAQPGGTVFPFSRGRQRGRACRGFRRARGGHLLCL